MLIDFEHIQKILSSNAIDITGAFHIGAHDCEELSFYTQLGLRDTDVIWIDGVPSKVAQATARGIPNVYNAIITDTDDTEVVLNVSNNVQSSSVLEFGTHSRSYPDIVYVDTVRQPSITVDTFFERHGMDASKYNFWNFDIQGAELMALKGATKSIQHAKAIYLEVNEKELYKKCALLPEIDSFLSQYGFKRVCIKMSKSGWGDALYSR
jgi:FkbM family methyltransferase